MLWPATGTTKGEMIDYYARIAPVLVPHLAGRAITLKRYPDGVDGVSFFEKNCPSYRPPWMDTVTMGDVNYCLVEEPADRCLAGQPGRHRAAPDSGHQAGPGARRPRSCSTSTPAPPADVITCARVALLIRELLAQLHLEAWAKTSGSKGLQLYVPLNSGATYDRTAPFAKAVAQLLEKRAPERWSFPINCERRGRKDKVLIDWSQNTESKTTVGVYSLRARPQPTVSTPVTWDELDDALSAAEPGLLSFEWDEVLERVERQGDLMADVLTLEQELPELAVVSWASLGACPAGSGQRPSRGAVPKGGQHGVGQSRPGSLAHGPNGVLLKAGDRETRRRGRPTGTNRIGQNDRKSQESWRSRSSGAPCGSGSRDRGPSHTGSDARSRAGHRPGPARPPRWRRATSRRSRGWGRAVRRPGPAGPREARGAVGG